MILLWWQLTNRQFCHEICVYYPTSDSSHVYDLQSGRMRYYPSMHYHA